MNDERAKSGEPGAPAEAAATRTPDRTAQAPRRDLPPAALRALAEAEERRKKARARKLPKELGGRDGPEPTRYGDWERNGIISDF